MSQHSIVVKHSSSTSHVVLNLDYLRTIPGLLKLAQLIIGAVNVGLVADYMVKRDSSSLHVTPEFFFLLMAVAFLIGTFCLLASYLVSVSTNDSLKNTYEPFYHTIAFLLYLIPSIMLLVDVTNKKSEHRNKNDYMAPSILGIIVSVLYLISALNGQRSYRISY